MNINVFKTFSPLYEIIRTETKDVIGKLKMCFVIQRSPLNTDTFVRTFLSGILRVVRIKWGSDGRIQIQSNLMYPLMIE